MTYAETRDAETLRLLEPAIDAFIRKCKKKRNTESVCPRQTMFFFPAGTASRLMRARKPFNDADPLPQQFKYDPVWVTPLTLLGGARDLAMHYDRGTFRDKGDRIIVADKAVDLAGCTPHDGLIKWARQNNVLLFIFPWDWRRRLDETATFFVERFLPHFQERVAEECEDPLEQFSLVGHSFGGMVVNLILRGDAPIVRTMRHAITVATPFYGYAGQVHRWFEGEDYLNVFGLFEQDMIEMIASLPGLYALHFLDETTFNANKDALGSGDFPLTDYPSIDVETKSAHADPYNPKTYQELVRYPGLTGFDLRELDYAESQFTKLAAPMDPTLLEKFHNIRGVKTKSDKKTPVNNTVGSVTWEWISSKYNATDASPIKDDKKRLVPGDGTQPAWTTCLVTNSDRCITVQGPAIDHAFLMNDSGVLEAIQGILCPGGGAVNPAETAQPDAASDLEIEEFLRGLSQNLLELRNVQSFDKLPPLKGLKEFEGRLPNLARRFLSDVMKGPGPQGLRPPKDRNGRGHERRSSRSRKKKRS